MSQLTALDLFAGTGWGVACQWLGIREKGVEIMPEAVETREANGMETVFRDVWDGLEDPLIVPAHTLQIASPPCQAFSMAGAGAGRKALDHVLQAVYESLYTDYEALRGFAQEMGDERIALVLTPLAYAHEFRPEFIAWEQVPPVLPVWEACAAVLRSWGYSVETGILQAEQYGVPQTRRRAILVARRDGERAQLPKPTHSRYYSRTPSKLDEGVLPWVSMAEALGWGGQDWNLCHGVQKHSARRPMNEPAGTVAFGHDAASVGFAKADVGDHLALRSNYGTGGDASNRGERTVDQPAPTLTSKADRNKWDGERGMTVDEAAVLQTYPAELRPEVAAWKWVDAPATTVAGDPRITAREHHYHGQQNSTSLRLTADEASTLQTFPPRPFVWKGSKSKQFLQIGNAVPPLLAQAILSALLVGAETPFRGEWAFA